MPFYLEGLKESGCDFVTNNKKYYPSVTSTFLNGDNHRDAVYPSSGSEKGSVYSMDHRLKYWKSILEDRKRIAFRIHKVTGKHVAHVLYNQVEEYRHVQNIKRLLDYAERLDPTRLSQRSRNRISDPEILETIPLTERMGNVDNIEFVGTPKYSRIEQWMHQHHSINNSFLTSNLLRRKLESCNVGMETILNFYPDFNEIEVIGEKVETQNHFRETKQYMQSIASTAPFDFDYPAYKFQVNDAVFSTSGECPDSLELSVDFKCEPYKSENKTLCKITNLGRKPLQFQFTKCGPEQCCPFDTFKPFHFSYRVFVLGAGNSLDIDVTFSAIGQMKYKETWTLEVYPCVFVIDANPVIKLLGEIHIPDGYFNLVSWDLSNICTKENDLLTNVRGGKLLSVYKFEILNPGIKCSMKDIQRLQKLYKLMASKINLTEWDYKLHTIREVIDAIGDNCYRNKLNVLFQKILERIRWRTRVYKTNDPVRIGSELLLAMFNKWESKTQNIVQINRRSSVSSLVKKMPLDFIHIQLNKCQTNGEKHKVLLFNSLYIHLYADLCDCAQDFVSFIENYKIIQLY